VLIDCCMPTCTCTHAKLSKTSFFFGQILNLKMSFFLGRRSMSCKIGNPSSTHLYYKSWENWKQFSPKKKHTHPATPHKCPTCQRGPPLLGRRNLVVTKKLDARNCFCRYHLFIFTEAFSTRPPIPAAAITYARQSSFLSKQGNHAPARQSIVFPCGAIVSFHQSCFLVVLLFPFINRVSLWCYYFLYKETAGMFPFLKNHIS
jgi:hypothetical protein